MASIPTTRRFDLNSAVSVTLPSGVAQQATVHQGVAWDVPNGYVYITNAIGNNQQLPDETAPVASSATRSLNGDFAITRWTLTGVVSGVMFCRGFGPGRGISVESTPDGSIIWCETAAQKFGTIGAGTKVARFLWQPNVVMEMSNPSVTIFDPLPGMQDLSPRIDTETARVAVHYRDPLSTEYRYALYALGDFLAGDFSPLLTIVPPWDTTLKGWALWGEYIYEIAGLPTSATNPEPGDTRVKVLSLATGQLLETVANNTAPSLNYREPRALSVRPAPGGGFQLVFSFATQPAGGRKVDMFNYDTLPPDPVATVTGRFDLGATAQPFMLPTPLTESGTHQQAAFDPVNRYMFITQIVQSGRQFPGESAPMTQVERNEHGDVCVTRFKMGDPVDGRVEFTLAGHMYVLRSGHGTGFSCEPVGADSWLWIEAHATQQGTSARGTKVGRVKFVDGAIYNTRTSPEIDIFDPFPGERTLLPMLDMPSRRICVRHTEAAPSQEVWYTIFDLDDFKARRFDSRFEFQAPATPGTWQSFCLFGQYIFINEGTSYGVDGNSPPGNHYISCVRVDGKLVQRIFQGAAQIPEYTNREPEALNVWYGDGAPQLIFGYAVHIVGPRWIGMFSLPLLPEPSDLVPSKGLRQPADRIRARHDIKRTSIAMRTPFNIASDGTVDATDSEWEMLVDRVHALVGTEPGDRVMRATYGVATARMLFAPADLANTQIQQDVTQAVAKWEPTARIADVEAAVNHNLGLVSISFQVARNDTPQLEATVVRRVDISSGGAVADSPA